MYVFAFRPAIKSAGLLTRRQQIVRNGSLKSRREACQTPTQITLRRPAIRLITNTTKKMKNRIFAILAAPAAIPPKPNIAAMIAITRNTHAYQSMAIYLRPKSEQIRCQPGLAGGEVFRNKCQEEPVMRHAPL